MVAALIDEACGLAATWYRFPTVTGRMFLRYRRPVPINRQLSVRAWVEEERGRRVFVRGELWDADELLAEARLAFVHVPLRALPRDTRGSRMQAWQDRATADENRRPARGGGGGRLRPTAREAPTRIELVCEALQASA